MMLISEGQLLALNNLADKKSGHNVSWINIADAQALTAMGLAQRNRSGWEITLQGACALQDRTKPGLLQTLPEGQAGLH